MTTKVHIVNFGPDVVEVKKVSAATATDANILGHTEEIYQQQSRDFYVYNGQDLVVTEKKP